MNFLPTDELYGEDLALGAKVPCPSLSADFDCHHLTDGLETSSWATMQTSQSVRNRLRGT